MVYKAGIARRLRCVFKKAVSRVVFYVLYRALKALFGYDDNIRREIGGWSQGFSICMRAARGGPSLYIARTGDGIARVKRPGPSKPDIEIVFKSIDAAFLVLTGQLGVAQAYAQHRFTLRGNVNDTMSFVRCVDITEGYLFPAIMSRRILKELPKKQVMTLTVYRHALLGI